LRLPPAVENCLGALLQLGCAAALEIQQRAFALQAPAVPAEIAGLAHDAVAGNSDGHRVRSTGAGYGAGRQGMAEFVRDLAVRSGLAVGNLLEVIPHAALESGGLDVERQVRVKFLTAKVTQQFLDPRAELVIVRSDFSVGILALEFL